MDQLQMAAALRARAALDVLVTDPRAPQLSLVRAAQQLAGGGLEGEELEFHKEVARLHGRTFDASRLYLPWQFLARRDLNTATSGAGGYLVATELSEARDILRPWSVTARAGITIIDQLEGNLAIPKTGTGTTGYWLGSETTGITASTPGLKQIPATPKTAGGICNASRLFMKQTRGEAYLRRELMRTLGTTVDKAVLAGAGASGEPLGLISTVGIATQSGTTLGHAGVSNMKQQVADANAPDEAIAFIGTNPVRELLETRERSATLGSGFVWDDDRVASRPAYTTTDLPAATLVCGAWMEIALLLWGGGFEFAVNPFDPSGFKVGTVQIRVMVSCDNVVLNPPAFCVATAVT